MRRTGGRCRPRRTRRLHRALVRSLPLDLVEIPGPKGHVGSTVFSPSGRYVYATNKELDAVEVLDRETQQRLCPIPVGKDPFGLDISPDGHRLYVAAVASKAISVVDTATRREIRRVAIPASHYSSEPRSIAVANNGKAIITTSPTWSERGHIWKMDLASFGLVRIGDEYAGWVRASADRSRVGIVGCGLSSGPFRVYRAATDSLSKERNLQTYGLCDVAPNASGSRFLLAPDDFVVAGNLDMIGFVRNRWGFGGAVWSPNGATAYQLAQDGVDVLDMERFMVAGHIPLPDPVTHVYAFLHDGAGRMSISPDGMTVAVNTDNGVSFAQLPSPPPTVPPCLKSSSSVGASGLLPMDYVPSDLAVDPSGTRVYMADRQFNQVEVFDLATGSFECPIPVASAPTSLDVNADGSRLYVATNGANSISIIDLATGREIRRRRVPYDWFSNDRPRSLAVARSGRVLITMGYAGSGWFRLWNYIPGTDRMRVRSDAPHSGLTTNWTTLESNAMRSAIAIPYGNISSAIAYFYSSATDSFSPEVTTIPNFISYGAVSADGRRILINPGTWVFDRTMRAIGKIETHGVRSSGVVFAPSGRIAYRVMDANIEVLNVTELRVTRSIPLPDTVERSNVSTSVGRPVITTDGSMIIMPSDNGVSFIRT